MFGKQVGREWAVVICVCEKHPFWWHQAMVTKAVCCDSYIRYALYFDHYHRISLLISYVSLHMVGGCCRFHSYGLGALVRYD